jgi:tRNA-2-methylthio-N6-dimethylallyladenosine synthase
VESITDEAKRLYDQNIKEITLLGQNVNSFEDNGRDFADLLRIVARAVPKMRVRYTTSHPYDCSRKLLDTMAEHVNICKYIHLPVQSGSERILKLMNRLYSIKQYIQVLEYARKIMPDIGLSTDIIAGFPTEKEEDHQMTLELMKNVGFDGAFMFAYSPRENTKAFRMIDDIPQEIKQKRLEEIIEQQREISSARNKRMTGRKVEILVESVSKKSPDFLMGRTDCNKSVIVPKENLNLGDFTRVKILKSNSATLFA